MPKSNKYMVIVADDEDETRGGIAFFETEPEAATHVESLLEAGSEHENISVFEIKPLATKVRYRPVVTIVHDGTSAHAEADADVGVDAAG